MKRVVYAGLLLLLIAIVLPSLLRARRIPGVQGGLGDVRTIVSAEQSYAAMNEGYFDVPACLASPSQCLPGVRNDEQPYLDPSTASLRPHEGYEFRFEPAPVPSLSDDQRKRVSKSSLSGFAVVAVPTHGSAQRRAFCGDSRGFFCARADGTMPGVRAGRCPDNCEALHGGIEWPTNR